MIASKLRLGDEVRVVAPSRNLTEVRQDVHHHAVDFWRKEGFNLTFSKNSREIGKFHSSSIASRVEDIHEAFSDPNVKMVITCLGGFNCNQLLRHLDYDLIAKNPKILCGYSDITALHNAIYAKTGLVTYHGPHFSTFGFDRETEYTRQAFENCVIKDEPVTVVPSEAAVKYHTIQEGVCEGTIIGGNLCTLNLLQGTPYMPDISDKVLFLEDDNIIGEYFCYEFDRNLESLLQVEGADTIKGIIFGRFDDSCGLTVETIIDIIRDKVPSHIPVIFGADFGHVFPMITFPIGGSVRIRANHDKVEIVIVAH
jgi:muramoyltetrapeptide carboxypeptidase